MFGHALSHGKSDPVALEIYVERAGAALACAFSSSAEFEAALIAARRAAGIYGPRRHWRRVVLAGCSLLAGLVIVSLVP